MFKKVFLLTNFLVTAAAKMQYFTLKYYKFQNFSDLQSTIETRRQKTSQNESLFTTLRSYHETT